MDDRQRATTTLPCIILRALIILLSIVVIVLCSIAVKYTGKEYDYEFYADGLGEVYISMAYLPVVLNMIWESIALGINIKKLKFHPGVDVFFETISLGANWGYGPIMIWWNAYYNYTDMYCEFYPNTKCNWYKAMDGFMYGSGALLILAGCFHLALLVMACVATHRQRRAKANSSPAPRKEYNSIELGRTSHTQKNNDVLQA